MGGNGEGWALFFFFFCAHEESIFVVAPRSPSRNVGQHHIQSVTLFSIIMICVIRDLSLMIHPPPPTVLVAEGTGSAARSLQATRVFCNRFRCLSICSTTTMRTSSVSVCFWLSFVHRGRIDGPMMLSIYLTHASSSP